MENIEGRIEITHKVFSINRSRNLIEKEDFLRVFQMQLDYCNFLKETNTNKLYINLNHYYLIITGNVLLKTEFDFMMSNINVREFEKLLELVEEMKGNIHMMNCEEKQEGSRELYAIVLYVNDLPIGFVCTWSGNNNIYALQFIQNMIPFYLFKKLPRTPVVKFVDALFENVFAFLISKGAKEVIVRPINNMNSILQTRGFLLKNETPDYDELYQNKFRCKKWTEDGDSYVTRVFSKMLGVGRGKRKSKKRAKSKSTRKRNHKHKSS